MQRGGSVLIHCQMGISRSATVAIAYLMKYHSFSRDAAYQYVKERRPLINPNPGFWSQLQLFQARLKSNTSNAEELQYNKSWAQKSLANFQTIGHICDDAECFSEISSNTDIEQLLFVATDFVFGRGISDTDLPWFRSLCKTCKRFYNDPTNYVLGLLADGSDFSELWSGEIYPHVVRKIKSTLCFNISDNTDEP